MSGPDDYYMTCTLMKRPICIDALEGTYEWSEPFWTASTGGSMAASGYVPCDQDGNEVDEPVHRSFSHAEWKELRPRRPVVVERSKDVRG